MLKGRNAIITGARSGIGLATVRLFASSGADIWAIVHRIDAAFSDEIFVLSEKYGVTITPIYMDLASSESIKEGVKEIVKEKKQIDILVNAAGTVSPNRLFTMTPMAEIRKVMEVNFFGLIELSQWVAKYMMRSKSGTIINIASVSAWGEDTSQLEYAASKAAVVCATKKMARELGSYGIRVNAVAPGLTETKMLDGLNKDSIEQMKRGMALHRLGLPEEIAQVCLFLASDNSSFITGETIKVDGGGIDNRLLFS